MSNEYELTLDLNDDINHIFELMKEEELVSCTQIDFQKKVKEFIFDILILEINYALDYNQNYQCIIDNVLKAIDIDNKKEVQQ